jgi:hypothetical protein
MQPNQIQQSLAAATTYGIRTLLLLWVRERLLH